MEFHCSQRDPNTRRFQADGWGWVKTPVTYAAVTRHAAIGSGNAEWRVFGIYYNDSRGVLKTDNRPAAVRSHDVAAIDIGACGSHYIQAMPTVLGTFDLPGWGALQNGSWGLQKQRSGALTVEGGFQLRIAPVARPWLRGGYFYSSGDGNANDNVHGTFFRSFPRHVYARFPFFNEMNNRDLFGELMLRPREDLTFRSDVHGLWLANRNDLWYSGGGAFQPWTFGYTGRPSNGATGLATLYDISADYRWTRTVSTSVYCGNARGGAIIQRIFPSDSNGSFGFLEINYRV